MVKPVGKLKITKKSKEIIHDANDVCISGNIPSHWDREVVLFERLSAEDKFRLGMKIDE